MLGHNSIYEHISTKITYDHFFYSVSKFFGHFFFIYVYSFKCLYVVSFSSRIAPATERIIRILLIPTIHHLIHKIPALTHILTQTNPALTHILTHIPALTHILNQTNPVYSLTSWPTQIQFTAWHPISPNIRPSTLANTKQRQLP
jgi:hypothetical protein